MASRGKAIRVLREEILSEAAALVWYHRADPVGKLAAAREGLAEIEAEIEGLEAKLPALAKARGAAKRRLDELRARAGGAEMVGEAHELWAEAGVGFSAVDGPLTALKHKRLRIRSDIAELEEMERPETPALADLLAELE